MDKNGNSKVGLERAVKMLSKSLISYFDNKTTLLWRGLQSLFVVVSSSLSVSYKRSEQTHSPKENWSKSLQKLLIR